jgi:hypothetical protein
MKTLPVAILAATCLCSLGCGFLAEASFELAPESRLPKWFKLPSGFSRSDVSVRMSYYIKSTGRTANFILQDAEKKRTLAEVRGILKGSEPLELKNPRPGSPPEYPFYEIITVSGITEIIEHRRMEPIFYITDDPAVRSALGVSH